jgi:uncharacterized coiled-coil DUF342 family protein
MTMPLTQQIIRGIVKKEIREEIAPLVKKIDAISREEIAPLEKKMEERFDQMSKKIDFLTDTVVDLAGQFKNFGEELTVLGGQMSDRTDRIEKLEKVVFGSS